MSNAVSGHVGQRYKKERGGGPGKIYLWIGNTGSAVHIFWTIVKHFSPFL